MKKVKNRSKGKGCRFSLGEQNLFNPCRASYCALGRLEKNDEFILLFKIVLVQNFWRGKELNKFCPSNRSNATLAHLKTADLNCRLQSKIHWKLLLTKLNHLIKHISIFTIYLHFIGEVRM